MTKHDEKNGLGKSLKIQPHSYKCGKVQGNEFQHSQVNYHFESWNLMGVLNIGIRFQISNLIEIEPSLNHWKAIEK